MAGNRGRVGRSAAAEASPPRPRPRAPRSRAHRPAGRPPTQGEAAAGGPPAGAEDSAVHAQGFGFPRLPLYYFLLLLTTAERPNTPGSTHTLCRTWRSWKNKGVYWG